MVLILKVARSKKLSLVDQCIENVASMAALNTHPPATHPPTRPIYQKIFFDGLRREWPVLHNEAAKYFLVLILEVARSKKLSLVDQCIENVASMAALNTHPPATHPPTRPHLPENIFLMDYVGNGLFYTMKLPNIFWY